MGAAIATSILAVVLSCLALLVSLWGVLVSRRAVQISGDAASSARKSASSGSLLAEIEAARRADELRYDIKIRFLDGGGEVGLFLFNRGQTDCDSVILRISPPLLVSVSSYNYLPGPEPGEEWGTYTPIGALRKHAYLRVPLNPAAYGSVLWLRVECAIGSENPRIWDAQHTIFAPRPTVPAGGGCATYRPKSAIQRGSVSLSRCARVVP